MRRLPLIVMKRNTLSVSAREVFGKTLRGTVGANRSSVTGNPEVGFAAISI